MKRCLIFTGTIVCLFLFFSQGYAQIDNLTNMSAEWIRMSNRNAATDAADIVVFNPAGLADLSEGFHINVSNQFLFRKPSHDFTDPLGTGGLSYEQDSPDLFLPNLYASYRDGDWSVFGGIYIPGGGAVADYPDGSYTTRAIGVGLVADPASPFFGAYTGITNERLKAGSIYLTTTAGGVYKISEMISVAAGIRNIAVTNTIEGDLTLTGGVLGPIDTPDIPLSVDVEQEDMGWGAVFGVQIKPDDKLNIALHVETPVALNLETDIKSGDNLSESIGLFIDGEKNPRDFPGMVGLGVSYLLTPQFRCEVDLNYWFQEAADWGRADDGSDISDLAGDCWSFGVAGAYQVSSELEVSAGFLYTLFRWDDIDAYYNANAGAVEVQYSDNWNIGFGFAYTVIPGFKLNLGAGYTMWADEDIITPLGEVEMENSTWTFALGIDYSH